MITYTSSLFAASTLNRHVKVSIKQGITFLTALGVLFDRLVAASSVSETKWRAPPTEAAKKNPLGLSQTSVAAGQNLYTQHCPSCHGPSGDGDCRDRSPTQYSSRRDCLNRETNLTALSS